jgi:hypothetical protein
MRLRCVDGLIRLSLIILVPGFWELGPGSPASFAQLKGGVSSNQQLDTSDIHVSQLINDIDHTVGIVGNAIRRGPVYENPVNADFAEFSAELKAGSSLAQQYSPCVQQYKNAYPHYLKAADLMEEYTRIRLTASAATLKSINQQMGAESNTGASFFTAARKCSWQVGQHADVFNSNGSAGQSNTSQPIPVPSPGRSPSSNPAPKSTSGCPPIRPSSPTPNSCGKWTGIVEGGFEPGVGHPNGPLCILCFWRYANGYPADHPWSIPAPPNVKNSYEPPGASQRACSAAVTPSFVEQKKGGYFCPPDNTPPSPQPACPQQLIVASTQDDFSLLGTRWFDLGGKTGGGATTVMRALPADINWQKTQLQESVSVGAVSCKIPAALAKHICGTGTSKNFVVGVESGNFDVFEGSLAEGPVTVHIPYRRQEGFGQNKNSFPDFHFVFGAPNFLSEMVDEPTKTCSVSCNQEYKCGSTSNYQFVITYVFSPDQYNGKPITRVTATKQAAQGSQH